MLSLLVVCFVENSTTLIFSYSICKFKACVLTCIDIFNFVCVLLFHFDASFFYCVNGRASRGSMYFCSMTCLTFYVEYFWCSVLKSKFFCLHTGPLCQSLHFERISHTNGVNKNSPFPIIVCDICLFHAHIVCV